MSNFLSSLYVLDISPLSDVGLVKIFSQSVGCHFVLLTLSFALQKLFNFMRSHLLIVDLRAYAIRVLFWKIFPVHMCLRTQVTAGVGKDVTKEKHFSIAGGIVNWYNHSGNQSGGSSENWN